QCSRKRIKGPRTSRSPSPVIKPPSACVARGRTSRVWRRGSTNTCAGSTRALRGPGSRKNGGAGLRSKVPSLAALAARRRRRRRGPPQQLGGVLGEPARLDLDLIEQSPRVTIVQDQGAQGGGPLRLVPGQDGASSLLQVGPRGVVRRAP